MIKIFRKLEKLAWESYGLEEENPAKKIKNLNFQKRLESDDDDIQISHTTNPKFLLSPNNKNYSSPGSKKTEKESIYSFSKREPLSEASIHESELTFQNFKATAVYDEKRGRNTLKRLQPEPIQQNIDSLDNFGKDFFNIEKNTKKIMTNAHDRQFLSGAKKKLSRIEKEQVYLREVREMKILLQKKKPKVERIMNTVPVFLKRGRNSPSKDGVRFFGLKKYPKDPERKKFPLAWQRFKKALKSDQEKKRLEEGKIDGRIEEERTTDVEKGRRESWNRGKRLSSSEEKVQKGMANNFKNERRSSSERPKIVHLPNPLETIVICDCKRHSHEFGCLKRRRSSILNNIEESEEEKETSKKKTKESRLSLEIEPFQEETTSELIKFYYGEQGSTQRIK